MGTANQHSYRRSGTCAICGIHVDAHHFCRDCGIGIGHGHLHREAIDGLCSACSEWQAKYEEERRRAG